MRDDRAMGVHPRPMPLGLSRSTLRMQLDPGVGAPQPRVGGAEVSDNGRIQEGRVLVTRARPRLEHWNGVGQAALAQEGPTQRGS